MPQMRPLRPLLQIASSRWDSRPQPGHLSRTQCRLFRASETKRSGSPNRKETPFTPSEQEWFMKEYRQKKPLLSKIWWTVRLTPWLLKNLVYTVVRYTKWRMLNPRLPEKEGVVVKSRIGRFFYDFVTYQHESVTYQFMTHQVAIRLIYPTFIAALNTTVKPWGHFASSRGDSMQPTFGGNPAISFASKAYTDNQDIKLGDVVTLLGPERDYIGQCLLGKRVAALGGHWILTTGKGRMQYILEIKQNECFVLGDNPSGSTDSRHFGAIPIAAVLAKKQWQWGPDGFQRPYHGRLPWLENKAMEYVTPGQNRPTEQPVKGPRVIPRPRTDFLLPPRKKERKDPRKKT